MTSATTAIAPLPTSWAGVALGTFGGMSAALQIGKVAATLPLIRDEFGAGLTLLATYVALISLVGAVGGIAFGTISARIGPRRVGMAGLVLVAAGSALGAASGSLALLMATRVVEALGFALTVTSMPAYVQSHAAARDRSLALGIWSTWMPLGIALMMVIGFAGIDALGWRGIFLVCAVIPACAAVLLARDAAGERRRPAPRVTGHRLRHLLRGQILLTAGIFTGFSAAYLAITAFLPTVLVDSFGMPAAQAALVGFLAAIALLPFNVLAGWLVQRGLDRRMLHLVSLAGMTASAAILLTPSFGQPACIAAAIAFGAFSGAAPGIIWASIPLLAPDPADAPLVSGTFFQSAGIGQVLGPLISGAAVEAGGGWSAALWAVCAILAFSAVLAIRIR